MSSGADLFINSSARDGASSATGYWHPHTASIDFCESNYLLSDHIVEPHNVWSSLLGLSLFGVIGIVYGNPTKEWRTFLIYAILLFIGLGSACLHASLHWSFQSSDELPMIYLVICGLYMIVEVDSPRNQPKYPRLPLHLLLLSGINTAIYYTFQHLYIVFLVTFSGLTILALCMHIQIARKLYCEDGDKRRRRNSGVALKFYKWHHVAYVLIASPVWSLDQFGCGYFRPIYDSLPGPLKGMTLHVVWHIAAGLGAHFFVQFLCACRANALGMSCDIRWVLGVIPVVVVEPRGGSGRKKQS
ncbi:hypothetical protein ACHAXT_009110 [Thalassiosira profunda]